jgi:16S rRNA G966 N2-methylase RsmD
LHKTIAMTIAQLCSPQVQAFIDAHQHTDQHALLLKKPVFEGLSNLALWEQIKGRKLAEKKLKFMLKPGIVFPPQINMEQCSSEATASFKQNLLPKGDHFIDLTSGLGIDAYYLSQGYAQASLVEQNPNLLALVQHNWEVLGRKANFINQTCEEFLTENQQKFDLIYLDPARRDESNRKKFLLEDLSPNLHDIQGQLLAQAQQVMVKLSPMIDLQQLIDQLQGLQKIWIVALKNEVKEVLLLMSSSPKPNHLPIVCVNLESQEPDFEFNWESEKAQKADFSPPLDYLFLPNHAILKSGAFNSIATRFGLKKLHPNSHLYTHHSPLADFPGRSFKVQEITAKQLIKKSKYNIIIKNYPLKIEDIKKKYQLVEGGETYLFFTQSLAKKHILISD